MLPANTEKCLFDYYYKSPRPPSKDLSYFKIFYYIIQFGCVYLCMRVRASVHMWRSEGSLREVVLSYHVLLELSVHQAWQCMPSLTKPHVRGTAYTVLKVCKSRETPTQSLHACDLISYPQFLLVFRMIWLQNTFGFSCRCNVSGSR